MNLDDFIRGLLNLTPSPSSRNDSGNSGRSSGGDVRRDVIDDDPSRIRPPHDRRNAGIGELYDFDQFIQTQMQSIFAPFFGGGAGGGGGRSFGGRANLDDDEASWSVVPNPAVTGDDGELRMEASLSQKRYFAFLSTLFWMRPLSICTSIRIELTILSILT